MNKVYCPNCDKYFNDDELEIHWGKTRLNSGGDEHHCPDCGEFEKLEEREFHLPDTECNYKKCPLNSEYGCRHYYTKTRIMNCKLRTRETYPMKPILDLMNNAIKRMKADNTIYLGKQGGGVV